MFLKETGLLFLVLGYDLKCLLKLIFHASLVCCCFYAILYGVLETLLSYK